MVKANRPEHRVVDPDQTPQNAWSDQGIHYLLPIKQAEVGNILS